MGELAWTPPPRFDDLEILRPLGAGGMGSVYLAREAHLDRLVAVKFVAADTRDPHGVARFHVEARALARLQHPNVVAVYRLGEVDGRPYLAYEYVDGQRVDRLHPPLSWPEVLSIILGVARGLAAAHAAGVLHRDLKPANLMRAPGGEVKILDFGLARIFDPAAGQAAPEEHDPFVLPPLANTSATWDASSTSSGRLTSHGSLVGTPLYLAPELWEGAAPTPRVDLYALGLIAYELLLGYHPREQLGGLELAQQVRDHDLPRLSEEVPNAPRPLTELIDRLVARDPSARPPSAQVVRDELEVLRALYRPLVGGEFAGAAVVVADSFERIGQHTLAMVEDFYRRWVALEPAVTPLFQHAAATQPRMLAVALKLAVEHLRDPVALVAFLEDLGRRHHGKGVTAAHFTSMSEALIETLAAADPGWNDEVRRGWTIAWNGVAQVMRRAVSTEAATAPGRAEHWRWVLPPEVPLTRWQATPDGDVAWQEVGGGPTDVIVLGEWVTDIEAWWRHPRVAGFLLGLATGHRLLLFDRRGTGCSTRMVPPTLDAHVEDVRTVMNAAGADRPVVVAFGDAGAAATVLAAMHPRRVRALVLVGAGAGVRPEPGLAEELRAGWGGAVRINALAPSLAADPDYRHWWAAMLRGAATPTCAIALDRSTRGLDASALLGAVRVPTLVVHRSDDAVCPADAARRLAAGILGARRVELAGRDHAPWAGDGDEMLAVIRDFIDDLPTDVVSTTAGAAVLAVQAGPGVDPERWRARVATESARHGGVAIDPVAGALAVKLFDRPARALACGLALRSVADGAIAIGVDVGPVDVGPVAGGHAVIGATGLAAAARPGQLVASSAVYHLLGDAARAQLEPLVVGGDRAYVARPHGGGGGGGVTSAPARRTAPP
ncbi:MAG: alpha/beta fold hydrolase [Myxococcales bacterium]|nr:alpha/beta fold hydrolase [Myxococcales bacterium]MBK7196165.1 alpha/beta fold hydrolase [Myxococcales bacterium]MBP6843535.1 alpha/beta fold hydrolase [Kofleriaceae bacterium]